MKKFSPLKEDLRKWFDPSHPEGGWKRINSKGEAIGPCAREPGEAKPKCMSNAKRASLTKKERAAAVRAKRKHDPNASRKGKPINVSNFGKGKLSEEMEQLDEKNAPTNPKLWSRAKALARSKFDVYPSAYANGWAAKWYKSKGGGWKSINEATNDDVGEMVKDKLKIIIERSQEIHDSLDEKELPEWIKSKITLAQDYISTVADYMHTSEVNEEVQLDEKDIPVAQPISSNYLKKREQRNTSFIKKRMKATSKLATQAKKDNVPDVPLKLPIPPRNHSVRESLDESKKSEIVKNAHKRGKNKIAPEDKFEPNPELTSAMVRPQGE